MVVMEEMDHHTLFQVSQHIMLAVVVGLVLIVQVLEDLEEEDLEDHQELVMELQEL